MNAALSASPRARTGAVTAALLLVAAAVVIALMTTGQEPASGAADEDSSTSFHAVGDGSLPSSRPALNDVRDPLSAEETGYAIHVATTDASLPAGSTDVNGGEGPEFLYADLPEDLEVDTRQAVVVLYDYTSDKVYQQLVDLESGSVEKSTVTAKLQPPTSSDEADTAIALAIATPGLAFLEEFESAQGVPLIAPEQVTYVAGAFIFDGTTKTGQECGADRCAQLMVQVANGGYLSTWDFVVNLSTKSIVKIK